MSVASSIPCIKIPNPSLSSCSFPPSSSSTSSTSSFCTFSTITKPYIMTIRSSQAEGPVRRPVAPPLRAPSSPAAPSPPLNPLSPPSPSSPVASATQASCSSGCGRQECDYAWSFRDKKPRNFNNILSRRSLRRQIKVLSLGSLAIMRLLMEEYATGSDFVDQVKILLSNFGIIDLE
uniref:Uncharacterized protein n=1 Tax=Salix viminalis TaxID=40686 RepID=A0A6N2KN55_SALVM